MGKGNFYQFWPRRPALYFDNLKRVHELNKQLLRKGIGAQRAYYNIRHINIIRTTKGWTKLSVELSDRETDKVFFASTM